MKEFIRKSSPRKVALGTAALLALFLSAGFAGGARAQDERAPVGAVGAQRELEARRRGANAGGLLRVLNLTPEQRARIGAIRRETEPQGRLLGARLREARRALDEAIYAADTDESVIAQRVRDLGAAQTEVVRLRSLTELRIRRVLTPEQLDAFRRLQSQTRRRRTNQLRQREGDLPDDAPPRFQNRMQRRREERRQQQRLSNDPNAPTSPVPRERRAPPSRDPRP